jgi:hypothetical protein
MLNKYVVATALAAVCSGHLVAAQTSTANQTGTQSGQAVAQTAPQSNAAVTLTGCVYREQDVPGRAPNAAERVGVGEDYILAETRPAASAAPGATPGATGTAGSSQASSGTMFKLEFVEGSRLSSLVGKRVEVTGKIDAESGDARGPQPGAAVSGTDRVIGRDRINLSEFEATSIREIEGTCPAKPGADSR